MAEGTRRMSSAPAETRIRLAEGLDLECAARAPDRRILLSADLIPRMSRAESGRNDFL